MNLFFRYTKVEGDGTYCKRTYINPLVSLTVLGVLIAIWYMYGRNIIDFILKLVGV